MNVRKTVSVHEKTVQSAAKGEAPSFKRARRSTRSRNSAVRTSHWSDGVDRQIVTWTQQHGIDFRRIEVVSPTEIIIHNPKD